MKTWQPTLDAVASIAMIAVAGGLAWTHFTRRTPVTPEPPILAIPATPIATTGAAAKGLQSAPLGLIGFSDFECPFCARFSLETLPQIDRDYIAPGKVRFIFRHLPLDRIHRTASEAARLAICADRDGKFWNFHDALFEKRGQIAGNALVESMATAGLDAETTKLCGQDATTVAALAKDLEHARALGVETTPSFFLGALQVDGSVRASKAIRGFAPFETFRALIDEALRHAAGRTER